MRLKNGELVNFLTEEKLGVILAKIFNTSKIIRQWGHPQFGTRKKFDYAVVLDTHGVNLMLPILESLCNPGQKLEPLELINTTLLIEFDGHFHYNSGKQVNADRQYGLGFCKWEKIVINQEGISEVECQGLDNEDGDCSELCEYECALRTDRPDILMYGLRIPYFVQLNSEISKCFFNTDVDYSDSFPLGFISDKCVLPEAFSRAGEIRFLQEISILPKTAAKTIVHSLFDKMTPGKSVESVVNYNLLMDLIQSADSENWQFYKKIARKVWDLDSSYKRLKRVEYFNLWQNRIVLTLMNRLYNKSRTKEEILEEIPYYERFHTGDELVSVKAAKDYRKVGIVL